MFQLLADVHSQENKVIYTRVIKIGHFNDILVCNAKIKHKKLRVQLLP